MSGAEEGATQRLLGAFGSPVTALVIGAGRGIGHALARRLVADPDASHVFATATRGAASDGLASLAAEHPRRASPLTLDVTDEASIACVANAIGERAEGLQLVINCAGVLHGDGLSPERRLDDIRAENMARSFAINATGPLLVAKHLAPLFPRRERVVFATLSARVGSIGDNRLGGWYAYRASKAAQNMVTRNLAIELRRKARGMICVALHPGTVDTELSRPFQANVPADRLFTPERAARQLLQVLAGLDGGDSGGFFAWDGSPIPW